MSRIYVKLKQLILNPFKKINHCQFFNAKIKQNPLTIIQNGRVIESNHIVLWEDLTCMFLCGNKHMYTCICTYTMLNVFHVYLCCTFTKKKNSDLYESNYNDTLIYTWRLLNVLIQRKNNWICCQSFLYFFHKVKRYLSFVNAVHMRIY